MNLYTIQTNLLELLTNLEYQEGEMSEQDVANYEILEEELEKKIHNYHYMIDSCGKNIEHLKDEKKALDVHIKANVTIAEKLEKAVVNAVNLFGADRKKAVGKELKYVDLTVFTKTSSGLVFEGNSEEIMVDHYKILVAQLLEYHRSKTDQHFNQYPIQHTDFINAKITVTIPVSKLHDFFKTLNKCEDGDYLNKLDIKTDIALDKAKIKETITLINDPQMKMFINEDELETKKNLLKMVSINKEPNSVTFK